MKLSELPRHFIKGCRKPPVLLDKLAEFAFFLVLLLQVRTPDTMVSPTGIVYRGRDAKKDVCHDLAR